MAIKLLAMLLMGPVFTAHLPQEGPNLMVYAKLMPTTLICAAKGVQGCVDSDLGL